MSTRRLRTSSRGYSLLMVLMLITIMTVVVTGLYTQTEERSFAGRTFSAEQVARSRAENAVRVAVSAIRSGAIQTNSIKAVACSPDTSLSLAELKATCPAAQVLPAGGPGDSGSALSLEEGGGLQYQYAVYYRLFPSVVSGEQPMPIMNQFTIRAVGYYGYSLGSPNLTQSVVEADVKLDDPGTRNTGENYGAR